MTAASGWLSSERIFTTPEFQRRYDEVSVSVFTPKVALVPAQFFSPERAKELLDDVVNIGINDTVEFVGVPHLASVLVYSNVIGETLSRVISETVLQLNPEVSTISFRTPLSEDDEMSLYRYFKSVDQI